MQISYYQYQEGEQDYTNVATNEAIKDV